MNIKLMVKLIPVLFCLYLLTAKTAQAQPPLNPIIWKTDYNKISSSNFYIRIGDKYFVGNNQVVLHSNAGLTQTTLEANWNENGVEMRLYLYFRKIENNRWEVYEIRTFNGNSSADWIYYKTQDESIISGEVGKSYYSTLLRLVPKTQTIDAEVVCLECTITSFIQKQLPVSPYGYTLDFQIGLAPGETITVVANSNSGYGVNALLMDAKGNVITDQSNFDYSWRASNPSKVSIYAQSIPYPDNKCAHDILPPCPKINLQISGKSPGMTQIILDVIRKTDNVIVVTNSFDVKVIAQGQPLPTVKPIPSPSGQDELAELRGEVGQIKVQLQEQKQEIRGLRKILNSITSFLNRIFGRIFRGY